VLFRSLREIEEAATGVMLKEIDDTINLLREIIDEIKESNHNEKYGSLAVRSYDSIPLCTLYAFDQKEYYYIPYLYKIRGANSLCFLFKDGLKKTDFNIKLEQHYGRLWKDSAAKQLLFWKPGIRI
jgi:hypothetical protein